VAEFEAEDSMSKVMRQKFGELKDRAGMNYGSFIELGVKISQEYGDPGLLPWWFLEDIKEEFDKSGADEIELHFRCERRRGDFTDFPFTVKRTDSTDAWWQSYVAFYSKTKAGWFQGFRVKKKVVQ
jgi:hypothetical protein